MERTEVAMVVLIGLIVYLLGVDIHESAMEAFLALIRYNSCGHTTDFYLGKTDLGQIHQKSA